MSSSGHEQPDEIAIGRGRDEMRISWDDGRSGRISAPALRLACRCGWCTRDRALGRSVLDPARVRLADVAVLGSHGLHVRFSDGHERGLFPWAYLAELAGLGGRTRGPEASASNAPARPFAQDLATTGATA